MRDSARGARRLETSRDRIDPRSTLLDVGNLPFQVVHERVVHGLVSREGQPVDERSDSLPGGSRVRRGVVIGRHDRDPSSEEESAPNGVLGSTMGEQ